MSAWDLFADITTITAWLDEKSGLRDNPQADLLSRVLKIGEEYGETVAALIGMTGQNPRKGFTHTESDVCLELADVIVTALCAMQHITQNEAVSRAYLASKIQGIIVRSEIPTVAPQRITRADTIAARAQ
jgi:hypothetical protein